MANRFQTNQHTLAYAFLAARDGDYCLICKKKTQRPLEIDHADNDPTNWSPDNLHLLCQKDNLNMRSKSIQEHKSIIAKYSANNARERERDFGHSSTSVVRQMVDYRQGSTEMQANSFFETKYREWLLGYVKVHGSIPKKEALDAGAELIGSSPCSTERYLRKLTSSVGTLKESRDGMGEKVITYKEQILMPFKRIET